MADLIHDFPLNSVGGARFTNKEVRIDGYETDKAQLTALLELFARAEYNVLYKKRPSGPAHIVDLTSDQRNIRLCTFSTEKLITGWYALKSISYAPHQSWTGHYPWKITLLKIGTVAGHQRYYRVTDLGLVTNDWGI